MELISANFNIYPNRFCFIFLEN